MNVKQKNATSIFLSKKNLNKYLMEIMIKLISTLGNRFRGSLASVKLSNEIFLIKTGKKEDQLLWKNSIWQQKSKVVPSVSWYLRKSHKPVTSIWWEGGGISEDKLAYPVKLHTLKKTHPCSPSPLCSLVEDAYQLDSLGVPLRMLIPTDYADGVGHGIVE